MPYSTPLETSENFWFTSGFLVLPGGIESKTWPEMASVFKIDNQKNNFALVFKVNNE